MKYLHLINDTLFTNFAITLFEQSNPGNNIFLVGVNDVNKKLTYTKNNDSVIVLKIHSKEYSDFVNETHFDVLVIHFMHSYKSMVVNKLTRKVKIVWLAWGGDIFNTGNYSREIYQPLTKKVVNKLSPPLVKKSKDILRNLYYFLSFGELPTTAYRKTVKKVNYCATVIPDEFDILVKDLPYFKARRVPFAYASVEHYFKDMDETDTVNGPNILVGNSVNPASNHIDVFHKLRALNATGRNIIVPLNYGEGSRYKTQVLMTGKELFGNNFAPLLDVMPEKEYIEVLKSCSVAIMNHERQQAVGNIIILLWLGCKIFVSQNSVIFSFFRGKGFKIYSFQEELTENSLKSPMDPDDISTNRRLLMTEYGRDAVERKVRVLIDTVSGNHETEILTKNNPVKL